MIKQQGPTYNIQGVLRLYRWLLVLAPWHVIVEVHLLKWASDIGYRILNPD
jgi:hypothetical protein